MPQRPVHLIIEKFNILLDSRMVSAHPVEYDQSTGEVVLKQPLDDQKVTVTLEGDQQETLAYSIKQIEIRFSEDFIQHLVESLPADPIH